MYTGLIFDFDGTLYDARNFGKRLILQNLKMYEYVKVLKSISRPLETKVFASGSAYKMFLFEAMADALNKAHPDKPPINATTMGHWYHHEYYPAIIRLLEKSYQSEPQCQNILLTLSRRYPLSLYADIGVIDERLRAVGLQPTIFANRMSTDETGTVRPAPKSYKSLAKLMRSPTSSTLVIGDSPLIDGESAKGAGMEFFHIDPNDFSGSWSRLKKLLLH